MYDYGFSTLEQYGIEAERTWRVRGALLCQTQQGLLILKEFKASEKKLKKQQELLQLLSQKGFLVDAYLKNQEEQLVSFDKDGIAYTLQHWYEGKECDTRSQEDIRKSIQLLAELHNVMRLPLQEEYQGKSLEDEYVRHNQELRKIRKFIRKKRAENIFEKEYLSSVEYYLEKGEQALEVLKDSHYQELRSQSVKAGKICHGEYHQHNVWMVKGGMAAVNFGHWNYDIQMADLYRFMRKVLEKYNWNCELGKEMIRLYHQRNPLSSEEWQNLKVRFLYPEKYWKIANYYYTHNKAWNSDKNTEKLKILIKQKQEKERFMEQCFGEYPF